MTRLGPRRKWRADPDKYNYGGNGSAVHLATALFLAGADLLSGRLTMYMGVASSGLPFALRGEEAKWAAMAGLTPALRLTTLNDRK